MKVELLRDIDYSIGKPVTFILSILLKCINFFFPPRRKKPRNILFLELSEMGSTILADPAMRKAKKEFGGALFFCIFSENKESLSFLNTIEEQDIFIVRPDSFFSLFADSLKFFLWARKRNIDTVVDLELFSRYTAIMTGLSGAVNRVGFYSFCNEGLYRGNMLTHKVMYNPHMHIAKNFIALVNSLSSDNGEVPYSKTFIGDEEIVLEKVTYSEKQKESVRDKVRKACPLLNEGIGRIVIMNPNARDLLPQRRWPLDRFEKLMKKVLSYDPGAVIIVTGAPEEHDEAQSLVDTVGHERCVNFTGKVMFKELPVLYSISTCMVTTDSGPGHFSAITDMPTFVLFGPESPGVYGSLGNAIPFYAGLACSPCVSAANHRKTPCKDNVCMQIISEEEVFITMKQHLKTEK